LSRPKSQHGWLTDVMPKRGKLPRGRFFGRWRVYFRGADGRERSRKVEKIIDRDLAEQMGLMLDYEGPLTKTDARKVLERLIEGGNNAVPAMRAKTTVEDLAREYLDLNKPNWGENTVRASENRIQVHIIGKLGPLQVRDVQEVDLQRFLNGYVEAEASSSLLKQLRVDLRAIFARAVDEGLVTRNPARKLKAKSRKKPSSLAHTASECAALFAAVSGKDRLAMRLLTQLGLRSEEAFALRRGDVRQNELVIDEALVNGNTKDPKTEASTTSVFVPPDLDLELRHYLESMEDRSPAAWLFPATRSGVPVRPNNFLKRVLKPAAILAGVCVTRDAKGQARSSVNFQSLRRTSSTLFGAKAKDPKSTQAHMRHADPHVTLKHYQQAVPAEVRAAAVALETDLLAAERQIREQARKEVKQ
jgi:integrase